MLYDHLSLQEKHSILILYLLKNFQDCSGISGFFFFSRPGILFDHFSGFSRFSRVHGNPGREISSISRGHRVTLFSWVAFFLSMF